jgi:tetratricopeptide (TPR) repeat protein
VSLDTTHPGPWDLRATSLYYKGQWEAALEANSKAIRLDPDDAGIIANRAWLMNYLGRPKEALALVEQATVMDPRGDVEFFWNACFAHLLLGQYELAIANCEKAKGLSGFDVWADAILVAAYAQHGEMTKAASAKAEVLRLHPDWTIATLWTSDPHLHPEVRRLADEQFHSGLRKAGFPEK